MYQSDVLPFLTVDSLTQRMDADAETFGQRLMLNRRSKLSDQQYVVLRQLRTLVSRGVRRVNPGLVMDDSVGRNSAYPEAICQSSSSLNRGKSADFRHISRREFRPRSTLKVFYHRHRLKVSGIDATPMPTCASSGARHIPRMAEVVQIKVVTNRSTMAHVDQPVCASGLRTVPSDPVSLFIDGTLPEPTPGVSIDKVLNRRGSSLVPKDESVWVTFDDSIPRIAVDCLLSSLPTPALTEAGWNGRIVLHRKAHPFWCHAPGRLPRRRGFARQLYIINGTSA